MSNAPRARPRTAPRARQSKPPALTLTFKGKDYRIADKVGVWPLMQFARAAEAGLTLGDMRGLAATHALLQDVIHPDDWGQFQEDMITSKQNDLEELLNVANQAVTLLQEREAKKASNGRGPAVAEVEA